MAPITLSTSQSTISSTSNSSSAIEVVSNIISNLQTRFKGRNAIRFFIVHGHKYETSILTEPTVCSQCRSLIWGLIGFDCKLCKLVCHKRCFNKVVDPCVKGFDAAYSKLASRPHRLKPAFFTSPTTCNHCGKLLTGILTHGLKCENECGVNLHHGCKELVCHPCEKRDYSRLQEQSKHPKEKVDSRLASVISNRVSIGDFDLVGLLGTGSFSKVYLARYRQTGQEFAIKVLKKTHPVVNSDPTGVLTEMQVLNLGRHYTFLAMAHCCFQSRERLYFVMEHVVGRDLVYHLEKARKFPEDRARFYAAEVFLAVQFLHHNSIIYRDLKLENVILDQQGHCKLIDFGMSKELSSTDMRARTFCGTPSYISPETIRGKGYDYSVDWWALGVLIYEMLVGASPFEADDEEELFKKIVEKDAEIPLFLSREAEALLYGLLQKDPLKRLGCQLLEGGEQAIREHHFFLFRTPDGRLIEQWDQIERKQVHPPVRFSDDELDCNQLDGLDASDVSLSAIDPKELAKISTDDFEGFSFCSESFKRGLRSA